MLGPTLRHRNDAAGRRERLVLHHEIYRSSPCRSGAINIVGPSVAIFREPGKRKPAGKRARSQKCREWRTAGENQVEAPVLQNAASCLQEIRKPADLPVRQADKVAIMQSESGFDLRIVRLALCNARIWVARISPGLEGPGINVEPRSPRDPVERNRD